MEFEWDEAKRQTVLKQRGVDFLDMTELFDGRPSYSYQSIRGAEVRSVTIAELGNKLFAVIWIQREECIRIITARRARNGEQRDYHAHINARSETAHREW